MYKLYIRVQDNLGKKKRIKANCAITKNQFKSKNHTFNWVRNHPNAKKINADLKLQLKVYNDVLLMSETKKIVTQEYVIHKTNKKTYVPTINQYKEIKMSQMLECNQRRGNTQALNKWLNYTHE